MPVETLVLFGKLLKKTQPLRFVWTEEVTKYFLFWKVFLSYYIGRRIIFFVCVRSDRCILKPSDYLRFFSLSPALLLHCTLSWICQVTWRWMCWGIIKDKDVKIVQKWHRKMSWAYGKNLAWQVVTYKGKALLFCKLKIKHRGVSTLCYTTYIYMHTTDLL